MLVRDVMTEKVTCCIPDTSLEVVSRTMREEDCGSIPVIENSGTRRLVGIITERDIVRRILAEGKNPLVMKAKDCMAKPSATVTPDMTLEDCCQVMEKKQIKRLPVVDSANSCCGIVSLADVAKKAAPAEVAEVVRRT